MSTTRISRRVSASRAAVYRALLDPTAVSKWMAPDGMTSHVHAFDAREGGAFRIYRAPASHGRRIAAHEREIAVARPKLQLEASQMSLALA